MNSGITRRPGAMIAAAATPRLESPYS